MNLVVNYKLQRKENDIMKFNDIMLDLDTGDASMHDAYVKAAEGKIDVASAIFEYAQTLQAHSGDDKYIQEAADAADEAGLPSDPSEASGLATAAVQQELAGFYDVFVENAKKVKTAADRDMKAVIGLGKKYGVSATAAQNGKFMITFAKPLAQALVRDCGGKKSSIKFAKGIFPTASKAHDLMFAYGNSMARLAAVFGIDISDVIEDPTVQDELALGFFKKIPQKGFEAGTPDVDALYKNLLKGSNYAKFDTSGKLATATNVDADDIAEIITYIYVVHQVSKAVASGATGSKKKAAMEFVAKLCGAEEMRHDESGKGGQKKISKKFQRINENIKNWAEAVSNSADVVVKSFSDAVSALGKVATGECAGIKDEGETTTESFIDRQSDEDFFEEAHLSKTDKGSLIGAGVGTLVGAGLTAATGGAAAGAIAPLAGLGVIIGDWIGMYKWRKTPAAELIKFIQDMADKIERRKGNLISCYNNITEACKVCMNTSDLFTKEQHKAIKLLYAETVGMLEDARSFVDKISRTYPYPSASALQSWIEAAEDVKKALEKGPANSDKDKD